MFSQIKDRKHIEHYFHAVAGVMPQGWDLGVLRVKNFSVGICDGVPLTALLVNVSSILYLLCLCAHLFIDALWSPAGKGLASWL